MKNVSFKHEYYEKLCEFLIELNKNSKEHINWNWARLEWMYEHPMFDKSLLSLIRIWFDGDKIVGTAIYDMYLGEASILVLPDYYHIYPEILDYAFNNLKDEDGLKVAVEDHNEKEIDLVQKAGFTKIEQDETIMSMDLSSPLVVPQIKDIRFTNLDPIKDYDELCWLFWQGFDHGDNKEECIKENKTKSGNRIHYNPYLSISVKSDNKYVAHCSIWYSGKTDYAYVEPVCVIPNYRRKGIAKAMIYENLNRARNLGAKKAYVISDMEFYEKLGFKKEKHYTFYQKS